MKFFNLFLLMNFLEEKILKEGSVKGGDILKVDGFLNHHVDVKLLKKIADSFYSLFKESRITKILTIESSGIAVASIVALKFGVPFIFAKKQISLNIDEDNYSSSVFSFTHQLRNSVIVTKKYLSANDRVLIVDDFIANGEAMLALCDICHQSGCEIVALCSAIEKGYMKGGTMLRKKGYHVESIAIIEEMDYETGKISFRQQ